MMSQLLNSKEVAKILGVSQYTVNYTLAGNEINYVKVCNKRMFKIEDVKDYIKRNTVIPMQKFSKQKIEYVS